MTGYDINTPAESKPLIKHRKTPSKKLKIQKTLILCYAYVCLGLTISVLGPSLLNLVQLLHKKLDEVNFIFTVRGIGYMVTTIAIGVILDKFCVSSTACVAIPKNRVLRYLMFRLNAILFIAAIGIMGFGMIAMPFIDNYTITLVLNVFMGISGGTLDCVSSVVMLWTWGEQANNYMQGLHAAFGVGSFLGPFYLQIVTNILKNLGLRTPWYINPLTITYVTIGLFMLTSLFLFLFIPFVDVKVKKTKVSPINSEEVPKPKIWDVRHWDFKQIIAGTVASFSLFFYCGVESGYSSYISPYVMLYDREHFSSTSALIASIFWLTFTIGRLLALPISFYLSIRQMLILDSIFCCASLLAMALTKNYIVLWITCITLGFSMASQYPTTFSAPTSHLNIEMSAFMTSFMILMANLASTVSDCVKFITNLSRFTRHS
jgi:fucose permease